MSTINVSNLILTLQQKIDSTTNEADLLYYAKALQQLKTGQIFSVASAAQLPSASTNVGSLYYVSSEELIYFASAVGWVQIYNTSPTIIFSWGNGAYRTIGDGSTISRCSPVREFCSAIDWCQVSAGHRHTMAIKKSGQLWGWGSGYCGVTGNGTAAIRCSPVLEFCSAVDWCQVSSGYCHTAAVKTSGQLWTWGCNSPGTLGDGTTVLKCSPIREICSATDWCRVGSGRYSTAAIKTSGELWVWGCNSCGRLGDGTTVNRCSPVREFCSATDWSSVNPGEFVTAAIKTSGQIWGWGQNLAGSIGDGTATSRCSPVREFCSATDWCGVDASRDRTLAIKTTGQIWAWGSNSCGRLGNGTVTGSCSPIREFCSATDWCQVSAGRYHTTAIKTSGQLWAWGRNGCGELGDGTTVLKCSPVREICSATDWYLASTYSCHVVSIKQISI